MRGNAIVRSAVAAIGALTVAGTAHATNGYQLIGIGAYQKGMGGAVTANPQSAMTAITNPAGIAAIGSRADVSMEWFHTEREAINEDYRDQEEQAEREHQRSVRSAVGQQLSSRLSDVSQGLAAMQKRFVQQRKQQLIEQGVAEEEAARRAEEAGRRRFAIKKKIAVAEALVNTYNAAMQVYNNTPGTLLPKIAAATAALTYGFAQVQKIRSMSIDGSGGGKSGGGVSVSGLGSTTSASGSQVTDQSSAFYSAGASAQGLPSSTDGDPVASDILTSQADALRQQVEWLLDATDDIVPRIALLGGMLQNEHYAQILRRALRDRVPNWSVAILQHEPVVGALRRARRLSE